MPVSRCRPPASGPRGSRAVLHVLYLIFNEGYTTSVGADAAPRRPLRARRIRLTRAVHAAAARRRRGGRPARADAAHRRAARRAHRPDGELIPLAEQDRCRWDRAAIAEGVALVSATLARGRGRRRTSCRRRSRRCTTRRRAAEDTDWPQILALYGCSSACPTTRWWRSTASRRGDGARPGAGLAQLEALGARPAARRPPPARRVRAHLLEMAGDRAAAAQLPQGRGEDGQRSRAKVPAFAGFAARIGHVEKGKAAPTYQVKHPPVEIAMSKVTPFLMFKD